MRNFLICCFVFPISVFGHGEDKPGPHGGLIRMPGAFHTEVLVIDAGHLDVYLLDEHFENPTVEDSAVSVRMQGARAVDCQPQRTHFACFLRDALPRGGAEVEVRARRLKASGNPVTYRLVPPLSADTGVTSHLKAAGKNLKAAAEDLGSAAKSVDKSLRESTKKGAQKFDSEIQEIQNELNKLSQRLNRAVEGFREEPITPKAEGSGKESKKR